MNICSKIGGIINNMDYFDDQNSFTPSNFSLTQNHQYLVPNNCNNYQKTSTNNVHELLEFQLHYNTSCSTTTTTTTSSSTSNKAAEQQVADERKHRRMVSNRESARRSRMRKKRQINELWSQILWLKTENQDLVEKLNQAFEAHAQVLQENTELKVETSSLRHMLSCMKLGNNDDDLDDALKDLEDL